MFEALDEEPRTDGNNELAVMDTTGDTRTIWNPENQDEVDAAKLMFDHLVGKGFSAFRVDGKGDAGEQIREFEPNAGRIILIPALAGG